MNGVRPYPVRATYGLTAIGALETAIMSGSRAAGTVHRIRGPIGVTLTTTTTAMDGISMRAIGIGKIMETITTIITTTTATTRSR